MANVSKFPKMGVSILQFWKKEEKKKKKKQGAKFYIRLKGVYTAKLPTNFIYGVPPWIKWALWSQITDILTVCSTVVKAENNESVKSKQVTDPLLGEGRGGREGSSHTGPGPMRKGTHGASWLGEALVLVNPCHD